MLPLIEIGGFRTVRSHQKTLITKLVGQNSPIDYPFSYQKGNYYARQPTIVSGNSQEQGIYAKVIIKIEH